MFDKLELLVEKFEELEKKIIDPEIMKDMNVWQKLAKEHGDMKPIVEKYREYSKHKKEAEDGDDIYYDTENNEIVFVSEDGYIRTYFKPTDGINYYNRQ